LLEQRLSLVGSLCHSISATCVTYHEPAANVNGFVDSRNVVFVELFLRQINVAADLEDTLCVQQDR